MNQKIILIGFVVLISLISGILLWQKISQQYPISPQILEISKEKALKLANHALEKECNLSFSQIERINWTKGPDVENLKREICPTIDKYNETEIWRSKISLNENIEIIALIGIHGKFVCLYGLDKRAAPGIMTLDKICTQNKGVTISTDKAEYKQGEIVKISVINRNSEEISLCNYPTLESPVFYVEKFENRTWITICCVGACRCYSPCMAKIKRCLEIQPNQTLEFKWYQKKEICRNSKYVSTQADSGKYRIRFNIGTSLNPIYSNEFTIKQS